METLRQPIELFFTEPKAAPKGLAETLKLLKEIEAHTNRLSAGPQISPKFSQSVEEINQAFLKRKAGNRPFQFGDLAKSLGLDDKEINQVKAQMLKLDKATRSALGVTGKNLTFSDLGGASKAFRLAMDKAVDQQEKSFAKLLAPMSGAVGGSTPGKAAVAGNIALLIPASQITATVAGPIPITIGGSQFAASGPRNPATGQFTGAQPGAVTSGGKKKGKGPGPLLGGPQGVPGRMPDETARTITQTDKESRVAVETLLAGGKSLTTTFDEVGNEIKRVTKDPQLRNIGKKLTTDLTNFKRQSAADILNVKTGDKAKDLMAMAKIKDDLAKNILQSFKAVEADLPAPARADLRKVYTTQANLVSAQAREAQRLSGVEAKRVAEAAAAEAKAAADRAAKQAAAQQKAAAAEALRQHRDTTGSAGPLADAGVQKAKREVLTLDKYAAAQKLAAAHEDRAMIYEQLAAEKSFSAVKRAGYLKQAESSRTAAAKLRQIPQAAPPVQPGFLDKLLGGDGRMVTKGLTGFTPVGMLKNTLTVGAWSMAVGAAMAPVALLTHSLERMTEVGAQTARLDQVFRGVGGSARELTNDVLALAAAHGRSTAEAMDSAIAWSRLGYTRVQVNEAVRVSLMAANVAEISAADATDHLASLTQVYGLRVSELEGVLGMLNQTSNTARVTNADLLAGLSNVAAIAKQAGFSLAELQGLLGAGVELTGQSGSRMGNALKTVIGRLGRDDVQTYLRDRVKVEATLPGGEDKSRAEVLRELFIAYQRLTDAERVNLAAKVAGNNQASRFTAVMDSYLRGQQLAVDAQLNLNSAQIENAKILGTLKAQVAGLSAEWDRFVVRSANNPGLLGGPSFNQQLTAGARALKNLFGLANQLPMNAASGNSKWGNYVRSLFKLPMNPLAAVGEQVSLLDKWLATKTDKAEGKFSNRVQEVGMRSGAAASTAGLYRTLGAALGGALPENRAGLADFAAKFMDQRGGGGNQLRTSVAGGDIASAQAQLATAERDARKESVQLQGELLQMAAELRQAYADELAKLGTGNAVKSQRIDLTQKILDLDLKTNEAAGRYVDLQTDGDEVARRRLQSVLDIKSASEELVNLATRMAALGAEDTATGGLDARAEGLRGELLILEQTKQALADKDKNSNDYLATIEKIKDVTASLAGVENPQVRAFARDLDRRTVFTRRAEQEAENAGIGATPAERLLNREKYLNDELTRLKQRQADWSLTAAQHEADNARALVLQNQLLTTREALQKRIRDLATEEKQARLEGQREFNRSLLSSGPADLLRKFAANQLNAAGPMTAGQYFSMAPNLRSDVDLLNGGDAVRRLREERARLRGIAPQTPEEEAAARAEGTGFGFRANIGPNLAPPVAPGTAALETAKTAMELSKLAVAATGTSYMLDTLTGKVTQLGAAVDGAINRLAALSGATNGGGLNTGYAQGEGIPGFRKLNP